MNSALFISFNNLFNCAVKIFSTRTYSFNKNANYSFNEFIHSKKSKIIFSKKISIQFGVGGTEVA